MGGMMAIETTKPRSGLAGAIGDPTLPLERLVAAVQARPETVELVLVRQQLGLTRFARGRIHQSVEDETVRLVARVWGSQGRGIASSETSSLERISEVIESARDRAVGSTTAPALPGEASYPQVQTWFDSTASAGPERRAAIAHEALERAAEHELAGHVRVGIQDVTVVNSAGLQVRTARSSVRPRPVAPGDYRVLLDPPAVSMILLNLGIIGLNSFSAIGEAHGSSFIAGNFGDAVASPVITLVDDGASGRGLGMPFDFEGTPKRPLTIIDRGIATAVAHDLSSASVAGATTGHALLGTEKTPTPTALRIEGGDLARSELVRGLGSGLVIRRIHPFVSLRGGPRAEISGTSRDGVFIVENGEIVGAASNVRWSCSAIDLLTSVEGASRERSVEFMDLPELFPSTNDVPSLLCGRLRVHGSQPRE
jgi:PmbA protein